MKSNRLQNLDPEQRRKLAELVPTSEAMLRQYGYGTRQPSAAMAIRIEKAAEKIGLSIPRSGLAVGCATCEYARQCERAKKGKQ
jgi:DNA-binding transcriptional regulator YdaS (Cro superfamily)